MCNLMLFNDASENCYKPLLSLHIMSLSSTYFTLSCYYCVWLGLLYCTVLQPATSLGTPEQSMVIKYDDTRP